MSAENVPGVHYDKETGTLTVEASSVGGDVVIDLLSTEAIRGVLASTSPRYEGAASGLQHIVVKRSTD